MIGNIEHSSFVDPDSWEKLTNWSDTVFPIEGRRYLWSKPRWHLIAYDSQNQPIGHLGYNIFKVFFNDEERFVIGIGGVVVVPRYQGQRLPQALFKELDKVLNPPGMPMLKTLFCPFRLTSYYARHGYFEAACPVNIIQLDSSAHIENFTFMGSESLSDIHSIKLTTPPW